MDEPTVGRAGRACVDRLLADATKQIALAISCGFALALAAALAPKVIMQRQSNFKRPDRS